MGSVQDRKRSQSSWASTCRKVHACARRAKSCNVHVKASCTTFFVAIARFEPILSWFTSSIMLQKCGLSLQNIQIWWNNLHILSVVYSEVARFPLYYIYLPIFLNPFLCSSSCPEDYKGCRQFSHELQICKTANHSIHTTGYGTVDHAACLQRC